MKLLSLIDDQILSVFIKKFFFKAGFFMEKNANIIVHVQTPPVFVTSVDSRYVSSPMMIQLYLHDSSPILRSVIISRRQYRCFSFVR